MKDALTQLHKFGLRIARADMVFWLMPPLIILLIIGTVAQKWMGLYAAHQMFFGSFILWAGPVPFPGGYTLLGVLTLNLTFKFLLASEWSHHKAGIILSHLGVLVLLIGGLLTAVSAQEHYMVLEEGQDSPYIYDYVGRELSIFRGDGYALKIPFEVLRDGGAVDVPFDLRIVLRCGNCQIIRREERADEFGNTPLHGMAQFMALKKKPGEKAPEANIAGVVFEVAGLEDAQDGIYIAIEGMPAPITLNHKGEEFQVIFGKMQKQLPFSLKLLDFEKDRYPGTDKARAFKSEVIVQDGDLSWPGVIEMNKPLRYKGYTFFQSSFERAELGNGGVVERSIFSVVENKGRLLPYIGTIILAIGLLLHIFIVLRRSEAK